MDKTSSFSIWAFINLFTFIAVVIVNSLANSLPLNNIRTGDLSALYPNLFVPAGLTFAIWGVIYILLAGFSVYGLVSVFNKSIDSQFLSTIGPWFLISSAANICWLFAWHWRKVGLSLIFMFILLTSLIVIYQKIKLIPGDSGRGVFLFIKLPFSIYLGWITVATIANITALLVNLQWNGFGVPAQLWTIIVIAAAVIITCLIIYFRRDLGFSIVIIWALSGIILKRSSAGDSVSIIIAAVSGIVIIAAFYLIKRFNYF